MKRTLNDIFDEIQKVTRETTPYNYIYEYYNLEGDTLKPFFLEDNSRKTYEKFKLDFNIGFSGTTSLRTVHKKDKLIGYVAETKTDIYPEETKGKELYKEALTLFIDEFNVIDINSLEYYLDESNDYSMSMGRVSFYRNKVDVLVELSERLQEDKDFKKYFYKIVK